MRVAIIFARVGSEDMALDFFKTFEDFVKAGIIVVLSSVGCTRSLSFCVCAVCCQPTWISFAENAG